MLSALLNSIQNKLGSGGFLVASVFPVVMFTVANAMLATRAWPSFDAWTKSLDTLSEKTLLATALVAGVMVVSYMLSALASGLLETFEGKHWPVSWFSGTLHRVQLAKLRRVEASYQSCVRQLDDVISGIEGNPPVAGWVTALMQARQQGQMNGKKLFEYPANAFERWSWRVASRLGRPRPEVGLDQMHAVRRRREAGREIPHHILRPAVDELTGVLRLHDADAREKATAAQRALDADCDYLIEATYFSRDKYQAERLRLFKLRRFRYPADAAAKAELSPIILAPTTLGNISRTMHSYAQNTYRFDLDVLWTRLQNALRASEPYYANLQDAKVQLDFFTACSWLAWLSTFAWLAISLIVLRSVRGFVAAGAIGPLVAMGAYVLACRAYSVFADVMRTGVDLFRFNVLTDLHLPLPAGLEEERQSWLNLASVMGYLNLQNPDGSNISVTYKHKE